MKRFGAFVVLGVQVWTPADMQTNHGSSNVQWFSRWKIRADNHDVLICHEDLLCYREREL